MDDIDSDVSFLRTEFGAEKDEPLEEAARRIVAHYVNEKGPLAVTRVPVIEAAMLVCRPGPGWSVREACAVLRNEKLSENLPTVTLAILARDHAYCLPEYLECIERLDYPKKQIGLYVRTNDNTDDTEKILGDWCNRVSEDYWNIHYDCSPMGGIKDAGHNWDGENLPRIARVRQESLDHFARPGTVSQYYFVVDADNFLTNPKTLKELVRRREPIASPLLDNLPHNAHYANFFAAVNEWGYYQDAPEYYPIRWRKVRGCLVVPVVHCTYLVERSVIADKRVTYVDGQNRYDFVTLSDSARKSGVRQCLVNDEPYGYLLYSLLEKRGRETDTEADVYREKCRPIILDAIRKAGAP